MINDLLILIVLLILSGLFSSTEIAFIVSNKIKVEIRARKNNLSARNARYFINNPDLFYSSILISNNIINITFASLSSIFLFEFFGWDEFSILLISSALILIIGELIPKYLGRELADRLVLISAVPLRLITVILYPFVRTISKISMVLSRTNQKEDEELLHLFDKEDIQNLIEESSDAGKMDEEQSDIISKVIDIREQRVYEAMTPRTDIIGVDISGSMDEVLSTLIDSGYSKIIIYDENLDNIKGIVFTKDVFKNPENLKSIMRDVAFVPETKKSMEMLNEFLDRQFSFAVVVDEFGGTAGIITVEDLIEELLGEIRDEFDDINEKVAKKLDTNSYLLSGKVEIDYLIEEMEIKVHEGDYETIAGYITYKLGRIPKKGESFKIDHFTIVILKSDNTKIDLIKLTIDPDPVD
ncbi:MAG: HlyC/CorC family transporter [Ignavibacteriae bacterium HGW-Ignavibacteriae-3]|nr:MAG: HlyC/CorC family transporter [Ignavibacteriae bacterium HGW-Ignavibacteriae-3]